MIFSVLFLHEAMTARLIIGAAVIMAAILLTELKPSLVKKKMT